MDAPGTGLAPGGVAATGAGVAPGDAGAPSRDGWGAPGLAVVSAAVVPPRALPGGAPPSIHRRIVAYSADSTAKTFLPPWSVVPVPFLSSGLWAAVAGCTKRRVAS
ncbi:hypothetical protein D7Y21_06055 [Corallococcus sp. AB045]|nr:hypothetical protein D7Y21_06055 [Corallococcus sp. AB045]